MKAPDKIYTTPVRTYDTKPIPDLQDNIYISKDYLLEWAKERLEEFRHIAEISNDVAADGEVDAFEELIDKLNQM